MVCNTIKALMNRIFLLICLLIAYVTTTAQSLPDAGSNITKRRVFTTPSTGQGTWDKYATTTDHDMNNFKFSLLEYKPRDSTNGDGSLKKQPMIIFLHGLGEERGGTSTVTWDTTTSSGVDHVYILPPMRSLRRTDNSTTSTMGALDDLVGKKFRDPKKSTTDSCEFWFFAPMQWGSPTNAFGFDKWPPHYVREIIRRVKTDSYYYSRIDTNRIYLMGHSLGGGGTLTAISDSAINYQLAAAVPLCPGYRTSPTDNNCCTSNTITSAEYDMVARSGLPVWVIVANDDGTGSVVTTTKNWVAEMRSRTCKFPPKFTLFQTGNHSIWNIVSMPYSYSNTTGTVVQTDVWNQPRATLVSGNESVGSGNVYFKPQGTVKWKSIYDWMLQFNTIGDRRRFY
jgi:hypothetical protein